MPKLGIQDLAAVLAQKKGLTKAQAESFVGAMFDVVNYGLDTERLVKVKGFGTFKVTNVKDRESINVNTGERVVISGHGKVGFTPEAVLRDLVNKPFAQFETVVLNDGVDFSRIDEALGELSDVEQGADDKPNEDVAVEACTPEEQTSMPVNGEKERTDETPEAKESLSDANVEEGNSVIAAEPNEPRAEVAFSSAVSPNDDEASESVSPKGGDSSSCETRDEGDQTQTIENDMCEGSESDKEEPSASRSTWKLIAVCVVFLCLAAIAGFVGYYFGTQQSSPAATTSAVIPQAKRLEAPKKVVKTAQGVKPDTVTVSKEVGVSTTAKSDVEGKVASPSKTSDTTPQQASKQEKTNPQTTQDPRVQTASKYDRMDVRVRTGAYAIVGVSKVVTVKEGETLKGVSDRNLGTGMECYVEVLNGTRTVKAGDKIKIPELVLKKRLKK